VTGDVEAPSAVDFRKWYDVPPVSTSATASDLDAAAISVVTNGGVTKQRVASGDALDAEPTGIFS
jgi:hypothetical protein